VNKSISYMVYTSHMWLKCIELIWDNLRPGHIGFTRLKK